MFPACRELNRQLHDCSIYFNFWKLLDNLVISDDAKGTLYFLSSHSFYFQLNVQIQQLSHKSYNFSY